MHKNTGTAIDRLCKSPAQSVILSGQRGIGKDHIATYIAQTILKQADVAKYAYYLRIEPNDKGTIAIDDIRKIAEFLRLKVPGNEAWRRVVHVSSADAMTTEAQNALLKTLEEPPADTVIILTSHDPERLLPTIRSRAQVVSVEVPAEKTVREFFNVQATAQFEKHFQLSGGLPGLLYALEHNVDHPLSQSIEQAKTLMKASHYERLTMIEELIKSKSSIADLLWALERIARIGQQAAASKANDAAVKKWHEIRKHTQRLENLQDKHPSQKLLLTSLALHL